MTTSSKYSPDTRRYAAQVKLLGIEAQKKLQNSEIVLIGVGGIGSPLLYYLAAAGIGKIHIFDNDLVEETNLGRQILYKPEDVGKPKVQCALARVQEFNPEISLVSHEEECSMETIKPLVGHVDYLLDSSDNFKTKYFSNDFSIKHDVPCTIASVRGFEGQLISINPHKTACLRCLYGPPTETGGEREPLGVVGSLCGTVGCLQANEVISLLSGSQASFMGRLLVMNLEMGAFNVTPVKKRYGCLCSTKNFT